MKSHRERPDGYIRLAAQRREEVQRAEAEEIARTEYVAKAGKGYNVIAPSFTALGDLLVADGYRMHKATSNGPGSVVVPHKSRSTPAVVTRRVRDA